MLFSKKYKRKKLNTLMVTTRKSKKWVIIDTELLANGAGGVYKFSNFKNLSKKELTQLQKEISKLL